jgi:hypothetical protein
MPNQHRAMRQLQAIAGPLMDGQSRSKRKRPGKDVRTTLLIVAAGFAAAYLSRGNGRVPLILGCTSVLVATCYWHRANQAAVRLLVGVVPVVLMLGMALAQYKGTKAVAADVTAGATDAQSTVSANMVSGARDVGEKILALFIGTG